MLLLGPGVSCPYTKWRSNTLYRGSKLSGPQLHPRRWLPRSPLIRTQDLMRTTRVERGEWASYTLVQVPLSLPRGREAHREERQRSQILLPSRPPCKNCGAQCVAVGGGEERRERRGEEEKERRGEEREENDCLKNDYGTSWTCCWAS